MDVFRCQENKFPFWTPNPAKFDEKRPCETTQQLHTIDSYGLVDREKIEKS